MKVTRKLILFLSLNITFLSIFSCKQETQSPNNVPQQEIAIDNNLIQNDTAIKRDNELPSNNAAQVAQQPTRTQVIQNREENTVKASKVVKRPKASNEVIMASSEFKSFMDAVFTLSDESTTEELNYVNSFMDKNQLWKEIGSDQCNLLSNEKIKSDFKVFHFWEKRCNFSKAQKKVVNKFNISYDALGKLMQKKRIERQNIPRTEFPEKQ
ncbi:MAG: hypothetical protein ACM3PT_03825 [Deltaproteobacteria bacterium]